MSKSNHAKLHATTPAFTLIEVLVTTIVIAVLATISAVAMFGVQKNSRDSQRSSSVTVIAESLEKYYQTNGFYPACDDLTKDPAFVTANILKGVATDNLTAPGSDKGVNSITCSAAAVNAYFYESDTTKYKLTYVKEADNTPIAVDSRYRQALLPDTTVKASAQGTSQVNVSWTAVDGAASYRVQRSTSSNFKDDLFETSLTGLSLNNTGLSTGTTYYFKVLSKAMNASSNWSNPAAQATTTVLPPTAPVPTPVVTATTSGGTTTFSWTKPTCAAGTSVQYKYRYTHNGGYDSKLVDTKKETLAITTSNEGYTFSVAVQAQCYTPMAVSTLSSSGSASYYRPITNSTSPVISISYSSPNVTATVSTVTCGIGATPQYAIRSRVNDGAWSSYSAWSATKPTASKTATQGTKYGYQAESRCNTPVGGASSPTVGLEVTYVQPINTPATPSVSVSTSGSYSTWSWNAATCAVGTASYQYLYTRNDGYNSGWVATTNRNIQLVTSTEGWTYTVQIRARCTNAQTSSVWSGSGLASYYRPYTYYLTVNAGSGGSAGGSGTYTHGTYATISAYPNSGYRFSHWSGDSSCSGSASHTVYITYARSCTANFISNTYYLSVSANSGGSAYSSGNYNANTNVTISAYPNSGYSFSYWSGSAGCSGSSSHTIYMDSGKSCTANFTANVTYTYYNLSVSGGAGGTTIGSASSVLAGSSRQISASPNSGYSFSNWSSNCSGSATHNVTVNSNISCTATFTKNAPPSKMVTKTVGPQTSSSFSATTSYNDGIYSGTLRFLSSTKNSAGTVRDSKSVSVTRPCTFGTGVPTKMNYTDDQGYTGTLTAIRAVSCDTRPGPGVYYIGYYSGTIYKNITTYTYTGTYTGTVYGK